MTGSSYLVGLCHPLEGSIRAALFIWVHFFAPSPVHLADLFLGEVHWHSKHSIVVPVTGEGQLAGL